MRPGYPRSPAPRHRLDAWLRLLAHLVPRDRRDDWLEEWRAELHARYVTDRSDAGSGLDQLSEAWGALADALCLRAQTWRIENMGTDIAFALRTMMRRPGFTAVAVLTLALGIGATTAIFSVVDSVLMKPLPYEAPEELVALWETNPDRGWTRAELAPANFLDWKEQATSFESLAAYNEYPRQVILGDQAEPDHVSIGLVSGDFFRTLGTRAALGRTFTTEETWHDGTRRVVLSHHLWRDQLGADPDIVGSHLSMDGTEALVVGVLPPGFAFHSLPVDLWTSFSWDPNQRQAVWFRRAHMVRGIGRLAPGVDLETAGQELDTIASRLEAEYPVTNTRMGAGLGTLQSWITGDTRSPLYLLLGAVGLVLLIACANVANLLLVRTTARVRELSVRRALGAGRRRLVRQLITENVLLAGLAAVFGIGIAFGVLRLLVAISPDDIPRLDQVGLDARVLLFATLLAAASVLFFGLAPAILGARSGAATRGARTTAGRGEGRFRNALVVTEVALALVVVLATGLLGRSLWNLYAVDPGFESKNLLTTEVAVPRAFYGDETAVTAFFDRLTERFASLPGVESVSSTGMLPIDSSGWSGDLSVEGRGPGEHATEVRFAQIDASYFEALGTGLVAGREFRTSDDADAPQVALVNEAMQKLMFPDGNAIGSRVASVRDPTPDSRWATVLGVVEDIHQFGLDEAPRPQVFYPLAQRADRVRSMLIRIDGDPLAVVPALRTALADIDDRIPLGQVQTMSGVLARSLARERFLLAQLVAFGAIALLLASVGTWSVLSYTVSQRRTEIGVRMAVGANRSSVLRMVLSQGLKLVAAGSVLGLLMAGLVGRFLESMLFGLDGLDPMTVLGTATVLAAVGLPACLLPARKAAHTDPTDSLRAD